MSRPTDKTRKRRLAVGVELAMQALEKKGPQGGDLLAPNRHPDFRNAPHNGEMLENGVIGFHDPRDHDSAVCGIQKEKPWHRMAAIMLNRGFSNIDIAGFAGVEPGHISILRAQRWFNELCVRLAADAGDALAARLDTEAMKALENVVEIANADAKEVGSRTKLAANLALLEHAHGKPTQKILSVNAHTSYSSAQEEYAAIQSELEEIRRAKAGAAGTVVEKGEALHAVHSDSPVGSPPSNGGDSLP